MISKSELSSTKTEDNIYPVYSSQTSNDGILGYDSVFDFSGKYLTWTTDGANAGKVFYRSGKFRCTNVCGILYNKNNDYINEMVAEMLNIETPKYVSYVGNPKLMNKVMADIKIKLPNLSIQNKISTILKLLNDKIILENNILVKLQLLKKGIIQCMFV